MEDGVDTKGGWTGLRRDVGIGGSVAEADVEGANQRLVCGASLTGGAGGMGTSVESISPCDGIFCDSIPWVSGRGSEAMMIELSVVAIRGPSFELLIEFWSFGNWAWVNSFEGGSFSFPFLRDSDPNQELVTV